jgi:hypothetical protein
MHVGTLAEKRRLKADEAAVPDEFSHVAVDHDYSPVPPKMDAKKAGPNKKDGAPSKSQGGQNRQDASFTKAVFESKLS